MKKRILKKSEVLREGYMKGLRHAQRIINEMISECSAKEEDFEENFIRYYDNVKSVPEQFLDAYHEMTFVDNPTEKQSNYAKKLLI